MATTHQEIERKYEGALRRPPATDGLPQVARAVAGGTEQLDAVYFDTAGLRLLRAGITLRRRTGGHDAGWHLKIPGADGIRTEIRLPPDAGDARRPPKELVRLTRGLARGEPLAPAARLRTRRERTLLVDAGGGTLAELVRDEVTAQTLGAAAGAEGATEVSSWVETEVELDAGAPDLLDAVERDLRDQGLRPAAEASKLARVLGGRLPSVPDAGPPAGSVGAALTGYLRDHVAALLALDPAVRADLPDAIHRMRVHVRRLRSALAAHRRLLDRAAADRLDGELRRLGRVLGRARDAEALGQLLGPQAAGLPSAGRPQEVGALLSSWFGHRYAREQRAAVHAMRDQRYYALLDAAEEFAAHPPLRRRAARGKAQARRVLKHQRRRTVRRLDAALDLPAGPDRDRALHRARKAAKRARYAAESVAPVAGQRAGRLRKRMKRLQEPLGAHHDAVVAGPALLEVTAEARRRGRDTFGYGLLFAAQRREADEQVGRAREARRRLKGA
ncbi:CYTH and CHAD domain-containing protein [Kitasatospora sp. NBC_00085]|uniref:CYTH and CHAD domain-containing protein n=1 Tax=unclassified Kitasatospora TaxID=2633591 RepID=UPI0032444761